MLRSALIALVAVATACAFAGGELSGADGYEKGGTRVRVQQGRSLEKSKIGPIGSITGKNPPLPAPSRRIGWGFNCHEFYGPTYYYPEYHNTYEGLHPQYYPFYHPRLWPNYKTEGEYCVGKLCGSSRSMHYWDSYDDWMRGGRYEEHQ